MPATPPQSKTFNASCWLFSSRELFREANLRFGFPLGILNDFSYVGFSAWRDMRSLMRLMRLSRVRLFRIVAMQWSRSSSLCTSSLSTRKWIQF